MISFEVPGQPVPITRTTPGIRGQYPFKPKKQVDYGNLVKLIAANRMRLLEENVTEDAVGLIIKAEYLRPKSWPKKRAGERWKTSKPDLDNLLKIIKDSMTGIVYKDDAQVSSLICTKEYGEHERLIVMVTRL